MYHRPSQQYPVPSAMSMPERADAWTKEFNNYCKNEPDIEQDWLELFHRALVQHEPEAWELLQERCYPLVRAWMAKHPHQVIACSYEPVEYYAAHTFTRVWQSSMGNTLEFDTLSAAMGYLKFSLQGVVIDILRAHTQPDCALLSDYGSGSDTFYLGEPAIEDNYGSGEMWVGIKGLLSNEHEQRLAYLLYHCHLKPGEIVCIYPEEFSNTQAIYQLIRSIIERLLHARDP